MKEKVRKGKAKLARRFFNCQRAGNCFGGRLSYVVGLVLIVAKFWVDLGNPH